MKHNLVHIVFILSISMLEVELSYLQYRFYFLLKNYIYTYISFTVYVYYKTYSSYRFNSSLTIWIYIKFSKASH